MDIGVDIDGVILNYDFEKISKFLNHPVTEEMLHCYSLVESLGIPASLSDSLFKELCFGQKMIPEADYSLREFSKLGFGIFIYTNKLRFASYASVEEDLKERGIPFDLLTGDIHDMPQVDFYIDDNVEKLLRADGKASTLLLYDKPWNRQCKNIYGLFERVENWSEIRRRILGDV